MADLCVTELYVYLSAKACFFSACKMDLCHSNAPPLPVSMEVWVLLHIDGDDDDHSRENSGKRESQSTHCKYIPAAHDVCSCCFMVQE